MPTGRGFHPPTLSRSAVITGPAPSFRTSPPLLQVDSRRIDIDMQFCAFCDIDTACRHQVLLHFFGRVLRFWLLFRCFLLVYARDTAVTPGFLRGRGALAVNSL